MVAFHSQSVEFSNPSRNQRNAKFSQSVKESDPPTGRSPARASTRAYGSKPSEEITMTNCTEVDDFQPERKPAVRKKREFPPAYLPPKKSTRLINDRWWDEINAELEKAGKPSVPKRARTSCIEDPIEFLSDLSMPKSRRKGTRGAGKENDAAEADFLNGS